MRLIRYYPIPKSARLTINSATKLSLPAEVSEEREDLAERAPSVKVNRDVGGLLHTPILLRVVMEVHPIAVLILETPLTYSNPFLVDHHSVPAPLVFKDIALLWNLWRQ